MSQLQLPAPKIWRRFQVTKNGATIKLRVQDLTEDLYEEAIKLLLSIFTNDEPPCKYIKVNKYPTALKELEKLWRSTLQHKLSLVCVIDEDGPVKITGLNVLALVRKDDKEEVFQTEDKIWAQLFGAVDLVAKGVDIFKRYDVDKYLTAYGLIVLHEYRGLGIGKEILLARIPLCKSLNVKITSTVFTAAASQVVAQKAGFQTVYEMAYAELAKRGCVFPGIEENTKSSKLMVLVVE